MVVKKCDLELFTTATQRCPDTQFLSNVFFLIAQELNIGFTTSKVFHIWANKRAKDKLIVTEWDSISNAGVSAFLKSTRGKTGVNHAYIKDHWTHCGGSYKNGQR